jgi:GT2 family glycosyltransferase/MoaA/NifB/PqqE/SkfB family radical SAM enzyme
VVWIELTSRCPLRCVFCSRETLRDAGEDMDFALFEGLVASLDRPEIIRLNYSGESGNYPRLIEAIGTAKSSSAQVELVTSLVSIPWDVVERLPGSGLDRLSVSLHTLEPDQFAAIYGGGTLKALDSRLDRLVSACQLLPHQAPMIDLAMVAMQSNVGQIAGIAALGERLGAPILSIHPILQREGVPYKAHCETRPDGHLTDRFLDEIETNVQAASQESGLIQISIARPKPAVPGEAAPSAFFCDQNPFETAHVLANGDVVVCEVLDRRPMGSLANASLPSIWNGAAYENFRRSYLADAVKECRTCVFRSRSETVGPLRTLWGWHDRDRAGTFWSRPDAGFSCEGNGRRFVSMDGTLPPAYRAGEENSLVISQDNRTVARVVNETRQPLYFRASLPLEPEGVTEYVAAVQQPYSPWRAGSSQDARQLGFALRNAEMSDHSPRPDRMRRLRLPGVLNAKKQAADLVLGLVTQLQSHAGQRSAVRQVGSSPASTLSVVIPERGNPAMLNNCLQALDVAIARLSMDVPVVVIVNGVRRPGDYASVEDRHPNCKFVYFRRPLGFSAAIRAGMSHVSTGWVYLLNSDVMLSPDALRNAFDCIAPDVFSVASRVTMPGVRNGTETNRTRISIEDGLVNLVELSPATGLSVVEHAYSGGGSSLFQTELLRQFVEETRWYDPFYWEDAEWGVLASRLGLRNLFAPTSLVLHEGHATVSKFYDSDAITRIFERNRMQFQLRFCPDADWEPLRDRIAHAAWKTILELLRPGRLMSMARVRQQRQGTNPSWYSSTVTIR